MKWIRGLLRRRKQERELSEEIRGHLAEKIEELVEAGVPREEAEHAARREFGNARLTEEDGRGVWRWTVLEDLLQDVRYGLRQLRKSPGFTATAILTLALGIGANTAIFSYVDAWLIKPLPYPAADRLMVLRQHDTKRGWTSNGFATPGDFYDLERKNKSFDTMTAWAGWNFNLTGDGDPTFVEGGRVSWNFFGALGAKPLLGRTFVTEDDQPGAARVAILGEGLWRNRFDGDPKIIGRSIRIDDEPATVVGVMPKEFQLPLMGIANLWMPMALTEKERAERANSWFLAIGKLKPGVTQQQASEDCARVFADFEKEYPETNTNVTVLVSSLAQQIGEEEGTKQVMVIFWIVGLILLIACANVANLMLARATGRAKEFALRRALGAARERLARQLLAESVLLFFFGGVAGTLCGLWGMSWIEAQIPEHIRGYLVNYGHVGLNANVLGFTLGVALLCGLVFGIAPALESSRAELSTPLKETAASLSSSRRGARLRRIFVGGEIALAVVVLIATTLLVRSFINSVTANPGFNPVNLTVAQLTMPKKRYAEAASLRNFVDEVLERLRAQKGVISADAASAVPFGAFGRSVEIARPDRPAPDPGNKIGARFTAVSSGYLGTLQIRLMRGRIFTNADAPGEPAVTVVNETLAKRLWPNENPIGRKMLFGEQHTEGTVVGVVEDIKMFNMRSQPERQMYVPYAQFPTSTLGLAVRTARQVPGMGAAIRSGVWAVDRDQPVSSIEQLDKLMAATDAGNRILMKLMAFFGVLAMLLGAIGIYGLMSQLVSQRTHEIGVRMALGARPAEVLRMVIGNGLKLALIGITAGVAAALAVTRSMTTLLYGIAPNDAATFAGVAVLFAVVAVAAGYLPARRAMRVDPMVALRYE